MQPSDDFTADDAGRIDFSVRFRYQRGSLDGCLMQLLQQGDGVNVGKELLLQAARAYWLAIAMQQSDRYTAIEVQQMARRCCATLQQQVFYLSAQFDLPMSSGLEAAIAPTAPATAPVNETRLEPNENYQSLLDQL